ncbi:MAG: hypothetical protein M3081_02130 [Gemmatimonadota bacterium]|nr:hypothetical protein [Gemmatimonadota bacterium]
MFERITTSVLGVLQQIGNRIDRLARVHGRRPREDLGADASPSRDQAGIAQLAQCLANGGAADVVLVVQLHLRRQKGADRERAARDPRRELAGDSLVDRLIGSLAVTPRPFEPNE